MALQIAVPKETAPDETRVAVTPDITRKYAALGLSVAVQPGAGAGSMFPDAQYADAGGQIAPSLAAADIVIAVQAHTIDFSTLKKGAVVIGLFDPYRNAAILEKAAQAGVTTLSMELVPRTTRAQSMDVLSSQANLAGYRAVLEAAHYYGRGFPMMMTAAGTVAPAKVFVMGAGVAGLQAIATAKRLGAVVSATDVRMAAKEQVQSLGGSFVMVEDEETKAAETSGGYAKEMSDAYKAKQAALVAQTIAKQDIVITTALIPGRKAPVLVTDDMVASMKPGSVIIDMAVAQGGNCTASKPGETVVTANGVAIIGHTNLPGRIATDASSLYARNVLNLMGLLVKDGQLAIPMEDDIIKAMLLTHGGALVHPQFSSAKAA